MNAATWPRLAIILSLAAAAACKPATKPLSPESEVPLHAHALYQSALDRLPAFLEGGFVVSRWKDGTPEHLGDSLLWTGLALGALPCASPLAPELAGALKLMLNRQQGGIYRHPDLADKAPSLDGALGLWAGVADRVRRCQEEDFWAAALGDHINWIDGAGETVIAPYFDYPARLLCYAAGGCGFDPDWRTLRDLQRAAVAWALAVKAKEASCYRVHLSFLALSTSEKLGAKLDPAWRDAFCAAVDGMDLPTVDHFCGRGDLVAWIEGYQLNQWEYRHQRCGAWESPDGKEGLETPAVDLLTALVTAYNL